MSNTITKKILKSCKEGKIEEFKSLLTELFNYKSLKQFISDPITVHEKEYIINESLLLACERNYIDIVKILYQNDLTQSFIDTKANCSSFFRIACKNGHTDLVEYLLTSEDIKDKPDINAGNPFVTKDIINTDESAFTKMGSGCPFWFAYKNNDNNLIRLLLDKELVNQEIHEVVLSNGLMDCLMNDNLIGAKLIIDKTNTFEKLTKKDRNEISLDNTLAISLSYALSYNKNEILDYLLDECKYIYNNELKENSPEAHERLSVYLFQRALDKELSTQVEPTTRKIKL